ncbi:MAG TPA: YicC/YloC family endoribonuclease [Flavipsychrobacter sp.]|nr:YicC/YloC family endoribonuclease [Flavipsychrobacter sp.]
MLYSMTGFGRAESTINNRQVAVEIKSLNGKQFEIVTKIPPILRSYELDIRNLLNNILMRGSLDLAIAIKQEGASKPMTVNTGLAVFYYQSMQQIAKQLGIPHDNVLSTLMRMPEVVIADQDVLPEEEWLLVQEVIKAAAQQLMEHRKHEGAALHKDLHQRIRNIEGLLETISPLEVQRTDKIRSKLTQWLEEIAGRDNIDPNRFEQEMIYYLERMDFSEEKTRLKQHCQYFHDTVNKNEIAKGKKLGFILQEIGREVNTLGAKANQAEIQQIVINMKDELEKAKEQVLNIL